MTSFANHQIRLAAALHPAEAPATMLQLLIRGWKSRLAVRRLDRLDNRLLNDIGVSRNDIDWALRLPMTSDAETALFDHVRGRARQRPAQASAF